MIYCIIAANPGEEVMATTNGGRMPAGAWKRHIAFCCFGAVSTTLIAIALVAVFLIMSGVLEW